MFSGFASRWPHLTIVLYLLRSLALGALLAVPLCAAMDRFGGWVFLAFLGALLLWALVAAARADIRARQ